MGSEGKRANRSAISWRVPGSDSKASEALKAAAPLPSCSTSMSASWIWASDESNDARASPICEIASSASSVTLKSWSAPRRETKLLVGVATGPAGHVRTDLMTTGVISSCTLSSIVMFRGGILSIACRWYSQAVLLTTASVEKTRAQSVKSTRQRQEQHMLTTRCPEHLA